MRKKTRLVNVVILTALLIVLTIVATSVSSASEPLEDPIPEPIPLSNIEIRLETVATGLTAPNWGTFAPGCIERLRQLFVTDQTGILWAINVQTGEKTVFLDVSDRLVDLGAFGPGSFDERGFLGVAFHPRFILNGLLYTYTSEPVNGPADFSTMPAGTTPNHQSVILEWRVPNPCARTSVVDPSSARELLRIDEPQFNHDGGALSFGPDDLLYIALGDGGAADDQGVGHSPQGNGQDPSNILGTIIRIDPRGNNSTNGQYGIPADNPFVGQAGFVDEIFLYGFRNPFRFSFDSQKGDMYIGDVGQNDIEEVDKVKFNRRRGTFADAGGNYGWRLKEGSFCFDPNGDDPGFVFACDLNQSLIDPIAEYDHDEGIAIIGGFVYGAREIRALHGLYVFGDYTHPSAPNSGRLFHLDRNNQILEFRLADREAFGMSLLGFGEDAVGDLYVLANGTGVPFGDTGVVLRIAAP